MAGWEWVIVAVFGILCGMLAIWTKHKQEMAKIAKGLTPKRGEKAANRTHSRPFDRRVGRARDRGAIFIGSFYLAPPRIRLAAEDRWAGASFHRDGVDEQLLCA